MESNLSISGLGSVIITLILTVVAGLILIGGYISCLARHKSWRKSHLFFYMVVSMVVFFECVLIIFVLYYKIDIARYLNISKHILLARLDIVTIISIAGFVTLIGLRLIYDAARLTLTMLR